MQGTGYMYRDNGTGYRVQRTGYRVQGTGYRVENDNVIEASKNAKITTE